MRFVCVAPERCRDHDNGPGHPERPARFDAARDAMAGSGVAPAPVESRPATEADVLRVHTAGHCERVQAWGRGEAMSPDPDTPVMAASWDAALAAAGGVLAAARAVARGEADRAFCAVRPPGHHAEPDRAMGFCLINNVAVAARALQAEDGVRRIAILDWDVHHGNGTQHSFYDDDRVFYASLHQHPLYPGTGYPHERGAGNTTLNVQMAPGAGNDDWVDALRDTVLPALERFDPELLILSCGFDAHRADPLAQQRCTEAGFAEMTRLVLPLAAGRVVSVLEGGYDLKALGACIRAHLRALAGKEPGL